jgi:hypothetical protein
LGVTEVNPDTTIQDVKKVSEQKVEEDTVESQHRLQNANCLYTPYMGKFNIRRRGELNLLNMMLCKKINNLPWKGLDPSLP